MTTSSFSGDPKAEWLTEAGPDRNMQLLEAFSFEDQRDKVWHAAEGLVIDGASIPRPLWTLVGSPYTGDYRRASVVHDAACDAAGGDHAARRAADRMFFEACRAGGCSLRESIILYIGVRIGAWWKTVDLVPVAQTRLTESQAEIELRGDFRQICEDVLDQGHTDDAAVLEQRTDEAFRRQNLRRAALRAMSLVADPSMEAVPIDII